MDGQTDRQTEMPHQYKTDVAFTNEWMQTRGKNDISHTGEWTDS